MSLFRKTRMTRLKWASLTVVTTTLVVLVTGLIPWQPSTNLAFADVVRKKMKSLHSLSFQYTEQNGEHPVTTGTLLAMLTMGKGRGTRSSNGTDEIWISESRRLLILNPKRKEATLSIDKSPEKVRQRLRARGETYWDFFTGFGDGPATSLGNRTIDGRMATGFRMQMDATMLDCWVDPSTQLPILVEEWEKFHNRKTTRTHFEYNTHLDMDKSLFSTKPPEGYTVKEVIRNIPEIKIQKAPLYKKTEQNLVETLRVGAEVNGGVFPDSLHEKDIFRPLKQRMQDLQKSGRYTHELGEDMLVQANKMNPGIDFAGLLRDENDFHYAGAKIKVGDAKAPVCWWKPDGSQTYRVIYGDLSVRDVMPENLPSAK